MRTHAALCLLLLVLSWVAPGAANAEPNRELDFETLFADRASAVQPRLAGDHVFRDEESWCAFWSLAAVGLSDRPVLCPEVDFRHEVVIASGAVTPARCGGLEIESIERIGSRRAVGVVVQHQIPDCPCLLLAVDIPIHAVVVSRPIGEVEFVHESIQVECPAGGR